MQDCIEKSIDLKASVTRVWQALTDHREFSEWFRVELEGPWVVGETSRGRVTYEGCDNMMFEAKAEVLEPERLFAYSWRPYPVDPDDQADHPSTLVEFRLEPTATGTRLDISECGFSNVPEDRQAETYRNNTRGWNEQAKNIAAHVES